jgi:hypothetical protein
MPSYRLLKHRQYDRSVDRLPPAIRHKAVWSQVLLGTRGRTPNVKSTTGYNARWRRTPVQGYHYYLWWIPLSESSLANAPDADPGRTILVHSIRHHDETDDPIDLRSIDEFEEVELTALDPRYDEQRAVGERMLRDNVSLATIKGLPGSGKTISLFYLVRDLAGSIGMQNILYVTYTSRLKRAAREFIAAQGQGFEQTVRVRTLSETLGDLLGAPVPQIDPFADLGDFLRFLELQQPSSLGEWRRYPETLYTELRAYLFGRSLPPGYTPPAGRSAKSFFNGGLSAAAYADMRDIEPLLADQAVRIAERLGDRFFADQRLAARALPLLATGSKLPSWLRNLDALIVDEVQDLTLLQALVLGQLARARLQRRPDAPLVVAVAGDESQIVQPSGFDWGESKDLMRDLLGANPIEFEFRHQRRSPHNLARLIDNAWGFYSYLPKPLRPSANRQTFIDDAGHELAEHTAAPEDENGRILICPLPPELQAAQNGRGWQQLAEVLAELPGRALIDLTEELAIGGESGRQPEQRPEQQPDQQPDQPSGQGAAGDAATEVVFLAREIKGLERGTVLVHGLERLYKDAVRNSENQHSNLPQLEARRQFDEMRVALSRSTDKLVLLEPATASVLGELGIHHLPGHYTIGWDSLLELLRTEQMSEIEAVEGYLDEADDLLERGRWDQARRRNRRAYEFAEQLEDRALVREAQEQYIRIFVAQAADQLAHDRLRDAYVLNRQAFDLADAHGDPQVLDDIDEQQRAIRAAVQRKADALVATAQTAADEHDYALAYRIASTGAELLEIMQDPSLQTQLDTAALAHGWQWGIQLLAEGPDAGARLAELFGRLGEAMQRQQDVVGAQVAALQAERYRSLPHNGELASGELARLIHYTDQYLQMLAPLNLEVSAFVYVEHWLEEAFQRLDGHYRLYYDWALAAQKYAAQLDYPPLDERLWDLENRVELTRGLRWKQEDGDEALVKFGALIAAYNGDPLTASNAWEKLGQMELAIQQARLGGDLERAYSLLRRQNLPVPEELATAVKLIRQAAQLETKHHHLTPAERAAIVEHLAQLSDRLRPGAEPDGDTATAAAGD